MITKIIYVIIDFLAILSIIFTISSVNKIKEDFGKSIRKAMIAAIIAITANILIALSFNALFAELAYCTYFASIDWILFHLFGFCLSYTEHETVKSRLKLPAMIVMIADSVSIFLNPVLHHSFYIYENTSHPGTVFYQTGFSSFYYLHLAIDYIVVFLSLYFIVSRLLKTNGFHRTKYIMILSVLLFVVLLNIIYMTLSLVLDASVIFYAAAGALICFSIRTFVPRSLMTLSIGLAVDDMNEGLIIFDSDDKCIYANSFSTEHFGIDRDNYSINDEPVRTVISVVGDKPVGETTYTMKTVHNNVEDIRHYRLKYKRLTDKRSRLIGHYILIEDTTEEEYYLNEIREARIIADNANRAKSSFLANMSHEIRTPLNSILGMNELIRRNTEDPSIREYAYNISTAGEALLNIINDVLDFSKIEAGKTEIRPQEYDPYTLIRNCYYFFEQQAKKKGLYIHVICDDELPSRLTGDPKLIGQILTNIVSNAVKYTVSGGVTLNMTFDETGKDTIDLIVDISDTGIGISSDDIPFLFDSFTRINEERDTSIQGTGLGLTITKELVALMSGTIGVKSEPGHGSRFTVVIPQYVSDHAPVGPLVNPHTNRMPEYRESFTAPDAHILIVDDSIANLIVAEGLLKSTQIRIDKATGGDDAIDKCSHFKYDLILLDHRMPIKDGIETFRIISSHGLNTDTPVIMLTANAISGMDEEYRRIGFIDYLTKPINPDELEATLLKHLPEDKIRIIK